MKINSYPQSRKDDIVIQEFANEVLIYELQFNKAYCLNQTAAMIWHECDGTKSAKKISEILTQKIKSNISEEVVWLALSQFRDDNLIANAKSFTTPLDGLTRREIIGKLGFASIAALPVISSVIAPQAINAASTCVPPPTCPVVINATTPNNLADGCFCLSNLNCASGICPTISKVCFGGGDPFCNQLGNGVGASASCCPCQSNLDCASGICPVSTHICF